MATTKKDNFEERKTNVITADNSREFSLQIIFKEGNNKTIIQEILEIAVKHNVRSYHNNLFTHYSKEVLQNFQKEIISKNYNCNLIFRSPKPLI